jgi:hypothetical protein
MRPQTHRARCGPLTHPVERLGFNTLYKTASIRVLLRQTAHKPALHIMQRIFSSATRRETLGKHLKGCRRGGELKIDWTMSCP